MKDQIKFYLGDLAPRFWEAVEANRTKPSEEIRRRLRASLDAEGTMNQATLFAKLSQVVDGLIRIQRYWTEAKGFHDDCIIIKAKGGIHLMSRVKPFVWTDNNSCVYPRSEGQDPR